MSLKLLRPLALIDLETTGVNVSTDRIIEMFILKVMPDGSTHTKYKLLNPGMAIPADSTAIHGITDEKVKEAPLFKDVANEIRQFLDKADLGGFNSNRFDIPLLIEEFLRVGLELEMGDRKLIDSQQIFHTMEKRNLSAAYKFYCQKDLVDAHSAEADVNATWEVLQAQVEKYGELGDTIDSVINYLGEEKVVDFARRMVFDSEGHEIFNFGKYKGRRVEDVLSSERQYYDWMMKSDFPLYTKQKLTEILNRMLLKKK